MNQSVSAWRLAKRPLVLAVMAGVGLTSGIVIGQSQAADIPQTYTPPPVATERVQTSFARFGPYVGVRGGFGFADDTDFAIGAPNSVTNEYDDWNLTGSAFAGYETQLFPGLGARIEAELGYSSFEVDSHLLNGGGATLAGSTGDTTALTGAVNAYVDADLGGFRPFAGLGLGIAQVDFDDHGTTGTGIVMNDGDTGLLWQVSGGLAYDMTDQLTLEGMVRYQSIMDIELTSAAGTTSETDLNSTSALVGLRYRF